MALPAKLALEQGIASIILDVANLFNEMDTSDLQGFADVKAREIVALVNQKANAATGEKNSTGSQKTSLAFSKGADVVPVQYWDSKTYNPASGLDTDNLFLMGVDDKRLIGQLHIDVAAEGGAVDDLLCATVEINRLPGSRDDTQCLHLHFDESNLAASFYKQDDKYIIRTETDVFIHSCKLPNGELGYVLGGIN